MTDETPSLKEQLARYDNYDMPKWTNKGSESERYTPVVTPRAFPSEIGFDIDAQRIPAELATIMLERMVDEKVLTLSQFIKPGSKTLGDIQSMIDRDGYCGMVHVYRIDGPEMADDPLSNFGNGGYLLKYLGGVPEEHDTEDVHSRIGYFAADQYVVEDLVRTLMDEEWSTVLFKPGAMMIRSSVQEQVEDRLLSEESLVEGNTWLTEEAKDESDGPVAIER